MTGFEGLPLGEYRDTSRNHRERPSGFSAEAAAANQAYKAKVRRDVLAALMVRSQSAFELVDFTGHDITSVRPRLTDLKDDGLAAKIKGERRKTPSGKSEAVWTALHSTGGGA